MFSDSRKDGALDRDIMMMLLQVLKSLVDAVLQPILEFFAFFFSIFSSLIFSFKYVILISMLVGAMLAMHFEHQIILPDMDDAWRCVVYPFVKNFVLSFAQIARILYALFIPFIDFLIIISNQIVQGTLQTFVKCANYENKSMLEEMIRAFALIGKSFLLSFQEVAIFFGDTSQSVFEKDFVLEKPIESFTEAIAIFEYPLICSCNQFTKPIQALFKIIRSQYVPLIVSGILELVVRVLQSFVNTFQGQFPLLEKPHNSIKRLILNIGFFADEILFISITHIVQTFDTTLKVRIFPDESLGSVAARSVVLLVDAGYLAYRNVVVAVDKAIEDVFGTRLLPGNRGDYVHMHSLVSNYDYMTYDTANNMQYFLYIMTNFKKDVNPFDSITTPTRLECDLSKVSVVKNVPLHQSLSCFYYAFSKVVMPIPVLPIPLNLMYIMYEFVMEFVYGAPQDVWSVLQRYAGMMIDLDTDASCLYRLESSHVDYSISKYNCQCDRRFGYAYRHGEREYTPNCLQPTLNYDVFKPMDKSSVYFWTLIFNLATGAANKVMGLEAADENTINLGKPFAAAFKRYLSLLSEKLFSIYKQMKDSEKNNEEEPVDQDEEIKETEINPDDFMDFPVMQRMVIEMMRLAVRVILALPDMLLGHYFSYPINCGWGLNQTRANVFFSEKFNLIHNDTIKQYQLCSETETGNTNCISYSSLRFSYCKYREFRSRKYGNLANLFAVTVDNKNDYLHSIVPQLKDNEIDSWNTYLKNPKIGFCKETNDNNDCICNPELYLSPSSECRCIMSYPYMQALTKTTIEKEIYNNLFYSKYTSLHWCNSLFYEYSMSLYNDQIDLGQWLMSLSWVWGFVNQFGEADADKCLNEAGGMLNNNNNLQKKRYLQKQYFKLQHTEETFKHGLRRFRADEYKEEQEQKYIQEQAYKEKKRLEINVTEASTAELEEIEQLQREEAAMTLQFKSLNMEDEMHKIVFNGICTESLDVFVTTRRISEFKIFQDQIDINNLQNQKLIINKTYFEEINLYIDNDDAALKGDNYNILEQYNHITLDFNYSYNGHTKYFSQKLAPLYDNEFVIDNVFIQYNTDLRDYNVMYQDNSTLEIVVDSQEDPDMLDVFMNYTITYMGYAKHQRYQVESHEECCTLTETHGAWTYTYYESLCVLLFYEIGATEVVRREGAFTGVLDRFVLDLDLPRPLMYGRSVYTIAETPSLSLLGDIDDRNAAPPKCVVSAFYGPFCNIALLFKESQESIKLMIRVAMNLLISILRLDFENVADGMLYSICQTEKIAGANVAILGSLVGMITSAINNAVNNAVDTSNAIERVLTRLLFGFASAAMQVPLMYVYGYSLAGSALGSIMSGNFGPDMITELVTKVVLQAINMFIYIIRSLFVNWLSDIAPEFTDGFNSVLDSIEAFLKKDFIDFVLIFVDFFVALLNGILLGDFASLGPAIGKFLSTLGAALPKLVMSIIETAIPALATFFKSSKPTIQAFGKHRLGATIQEAWTKNTECASVIQAIANKTIDEYTSYEKITIVQCIEYKQLARVFFKGLALKHIPEDILYNWKSKYHLMYQFVHGTYIYFTAKTVNDYQLLLEEYSIDYKIINELHALLRRAWMYVWQRSSLNFIVESVMSAFDPRYNDHHNPSAIARLYRIFINGGRMVHDVRVKWKRHHMNAKLYIMTNDMFHSVHHFVKTRVMMVNRTHFDHLKHHALTKYREFHSYWYADIRKKPKTANLGSYGTSDRKTCKESSCVDCHLLSNAMDVTNRVASSMSGFYNVSYPGISDSVEDYFRQLNQTTRVYINDAVDRLLAPKKPRPWYKMIEGNWNDLVYDFYGNIYHFLHAVTLFVVTLDKNLTLQKNITSSGITFKLNNKSIEEDFIKRNEIICGNQSLTLEEFKRKKEPVCTTHIPFSFFGLPYLLQFPFTEKCDLESMIYQKRENRVESFDQAFWDCFIINVIILSNSYWSFIPLSSFISILILIPINYFSFLYSVYGFVPMCAPALPVMLVEDSYDWIINRVIPACFCTYFPNLATDCPASTCERCIEKSYEYGNCNELLNLNVSSSVSYNIVDEVSIFWNLFYVAKRDFPEQYAFFVREGYLSLDSAVGILGMQAWQNTTLPPVWQDCHHATFLNFIVSILIIVFGTGVILRMVVVLFKTIFNLIFLAWNLLLFVSYTTMALDASTVSKK